MRQLWEDRTHAATCYLKDKDARVNKLGSEIQGHTLNARETRRGEIKCYKCGEAGHMVRDYKKPRHARRNMPLAEPGLGHRPPDRINPKYWVGECRRL